MGMTPHLRPDCLVMVDDQIVGAIDTSAPKASKVKPGEVEVELSFRPNWVGVWHVMALALDGCPDA